jgi:hypothetical protein
MSAGSGASNLGYGNFAPLSNVNGQYVNIDNSNYAGRFSSNEIPGTLPGPLPGLAGAKSNIDAAAGKVPGICMSGGSKHIKRKIKNITKQYKRMKAGSRKLKSIKRRLRSRAASRRFSRSFVGGRRYRRISRARHISRGRSMKGGYSQYQNNMPMTPSYQVAGVNLPASQLGLANPPPITTLCNTTNCVDNYNHSTNQGFPSKGH